MPRKRSPGPNHPIPRTKPEPGPHSEEGVTPDVASHVEPVLPFPVVGVGASAGGLEASTQLLQALPADTGMAFVLVHHLSPGHTSMLAEILSRATQMQVRTVENDMVLEPDHVYVIPPDHHIEMSGGMLKLVPRARFDGAHRPINQFLQSLATEQGFKAIAVILSGTANDGTAGCEAVKAEGGITFAQDQTAQQDSMPRSAVAAGCIDFVLPPEEIGREIARIAKHPLVGPETEPLHEDSQLTDILEFVRKQTGVDFTYYKSNTLLRRITRRMVLHHIEGMTEYRQYLEATPGEAEALFQDILINVTSFFRNPDGFELLRLQVFPELVRGRNRQVPVRVWALGCSTGEEAYSLSMAFSEYASAHRKVIPLQIFASDLSGSAIERARLGYYSKAIEQDVSHERLRRFFTETDGGYRIAKSIRDMVVFARHNALTDPPFSHIDLITCRNVLIYLDSVLQQRLIPILHYALSPGGYLWLGSSETVGPFRHLFEIADSRQKLYQRKPVPTQLTGSLPRVELPRDTSRPVRESPELALAGVDANREADRLLLSRYAPPGALVDADFRIVLLRGDTSQYLTPSPGRASLELLKMLREGLVVGTRGALLKAKREGRPVRQDGLSTRIGDTEIKVSVEVIPVKSAVGRDTSYLVLFDDAASARERARPARLSPADPPRGDRAAAEVVRLQQELASTREYLQSLIEQQEAANEELQSANEEVQSSNEELQSINEELETSKEEIQSSSEELATVNDELTTRNLELAQSNNDLTNLISSVQTPIVMLGPDFRIRRFTPSAEKLLNLIATDLGRPISDIKTNVDLPELEPLLAEVMESVIPQESVVRGRNGRWYSLRLSPYRTMENRIEGVVLMLVDITSLKEAEDSLRRSAERLTVFQGESPLGIREVDVEGRYLQVNDAYCQITGFAREELLGRPFQDFLPPEDRGPAVDLLRQAFAREIPSYREERRHVHKDGRRIWVEAHGFALRDSEGRPTSVVAFVQDVTERKQAEAELRAADRTKNEFLAMLAHELRNPLAPLLNVSQLLAVPSLTPESVASLRGILGRQIRNLSRMTDDLLDISRISRGRIQLHLEVVDLVALTERSVELFRSVIQGRGQILHVDIPGEPLFLEGDPVRLEQLIDNLLTNASKFADDDGQIWLSLRRTTQLAPEVAELVVRDNGRGIASDLLPRVFDPFVQAEQTLDRTRGGLGIGLTLVRHIAQLHRGTVEGRSQGIGTGAEFVVRLPLAVRPAPDLAERRRSTPARPRRILIVDDNPDAADTLAALLRHEGHEVRVAPDGEVAMAIHQAFSPEIVILDMGLPGRDGIEVARELRARVGAAPLHIVAVTGYGQEELRVRSREVGIEHYFTKPVDIANLVRLFNGLA